MADESREEQSSGAAEKRTPPAEQRPPERSQGGDSNAPRPFAERRPPARAGADEERYTRDVWKGYARLKLGVSPHAVAGALAHHDPAEEIGEDAVRQALDQFSARRGA